MNFFVPHAADDAEAESVYRSFAAFVGSHAPDQRERRIYGLSWEHNGRAMSVKIGEAMPAYYELRGEPALAIFDSGDHFKICTPSRGGVRGGAVLAGKHRSSITYFHA